MNVENRNPLKLPDGTRGYSSTRLIICAGRCTSTGWRAVRSLPWKTGVASGKESRCGMSSKAWPSGQELCDETGDNGSEAQDKGARESPRPLHLLRRLASPPSPCFSQVLILHVLKVVCFHTDL